MKKSIEGCCGCCGRRVPWSAMWCEDCRAHIKPQDCYGSLPSWERTYYAQQKERCPFTPLADITDVSKFSWRNAQSYADFSLVAYNDFALNASGIAAVLCLRGSVPTMPRGKNDAHSHQMRRT